MIACRSPAAELIEERALPDIRQWADPAEQGPEGHGVEVGDVESQRRRWRRASGEQSWSSRRWLRGQRSSSPRVITAHRQSASSWRRTPSPSIVADRFGDVCRVEHEATAPTLGPCRSTPGTGRPVHRVRPSSARPGAARTGRPSPVIRTGVRPSRQPLHNPGPANPYPGYLDPANPDPANPGPSTSGPHNTCQGRPGPASPSRTLPPCARSVRR